MTRDEVALLLQVALLGEVSPPLRGVGFPLEGERIRIFFYYDGPISEEDGESASNVETEVMAGVTRPGEVFAEVIRLDAPTKPPDPLRWVYRRRE